MRFEFQQDSVILKLHVFSHNFSACGAVHIELVDLSTDSPLKSNVLKMPKIIEMLLLSYCKKKKGFPLKTTKNLVLFILFSPFFHKNIRIIMEKLVI